AGIATMIRAGVSLASMVAEAKKKDDAGQAGDIPKMKPTPEQRAAAHAIMDALAGLTSGVEGDETLEGVHVQAESYGAQIAKVSIGMGFGAPNGKTDLHLRLAVDGFSSPQVPPGVYRDYLPKHIALSPRVTGVPKAELMKLIQEAIDSDDTDADAMKEK